MGSTGRSQHDKTVQVLVVAPSQELAMQILRVAQDLLPDKDQKPLAQHAIGGANPKRQHEALRQHRPMIVVGTPGRIVELIESGALQAQHCPLLVLDEARPRSTCDCLMLTCLEYYIISRSAFARRWTSSLVRSSELKLTGS